MSGRCVSADPAALFAALELLGSLRTFAAFDAVDDFIKIMKQTFDFANIYKSGIMGDKNKPIEEPEIMQSDKTGIKQGVSAKVTFPSFIAQGSASSEREIANYPVGRGLKARILISGASSVTGDAIEKLIKLLELNKEDLPEIIPDEKADPTEN